ncbi:MAG: CarD family transcriptional regulator [Bacillota bacterium]
MFESGDKIVYPNHGAGTITDVEEKEVLGETKKYYVMQLPIGEMKVMIPMDNIEDIGIREVINSERVDDVFQVLKGEKSEMSQNWNRRYRANTEKIKSGDIFEVAEVVRNLTLRDIEKGLSTGEKKMLSNSRQILISELVLAKDEDKEVIEEEIDEIFYDEEQEEEEE